MILYGIAAYFLLAVAGVALALFPGCRTRVQGFVGSIASAGRTPAIRLAGPATHALRWPLHGLRDIAGWLVARPLRAAGGIVLVCAPPLLVLSLQGPAIFDFNDDLRIADRQIATLLEGEQLVPPPPLPPAVFTTREVEQVRPNIVRASRNWQQLDQEFTQRLLVVFKLMQERHGYQMALIEGYRSPERQAELFSRGSNVTQARAGMSYHQYGLAADVAFFRDGKVVISERDPWAMRGYALYGEIAEQVGLTWGGRWKMRDLGHVELRRKGVLGQTARLATDANPQLE